MRYRSPVGPTLSLERVNEKGQSLAQKLYRCSFQ